MPSGSSLYSVRRPVTLTLGSILGRSALPYVWTVESDQKGTSSDRAIAVHGNFDFRFCISIFTYLEFPKWILKRLDPISKHERNKFPPECAEALDGRQDSTFLPFR